MSRSNARSSTSNDAGAAVGEPLAVQRQVELAGLERDQAGELDAPGAHARRADDQDALVVQHDAHVVQDRRRRC